MNVKVVYPAKNIRHEHSSCRYLLGKAPPSFSGNYQRCCQYLSERLGLERDCHMELMDDMVICVYSNTY